MGVERTILLRLCPEQVSETLSARIKMFSLLCACIRITSPYNTIDQLLCLLNKQHMASHVVSAAFTVRASVLCDRCPALTATPLEQRHRHVYLISEIEEITDKWDQLLNLGDEEALATFIGKCILRVKKVPMVS